MAKRTPEQIAEAIAAKTARRVAELKAKKKASEALGDLRPASLSVRLVRGSSYALLIAAFAIIAAGYWYDLLFYAQQAATWQGMIGLLAFAFVARTVATGAPVVLQWARPEKVKADEEDDAPWWRRVARASFGGENRAARTSLRVLWVGSLIACGFATLSFFSSGHEQRLATGAALERQDEAITASAQVRVNELVAQRDAAAATYERTLEALEGTRKTIEDQVVGVSTDDNETLRDLSAQILLATENYNATVAGLNQQINGIRAEQADDNIEVAVDRATAIPFLGVYRFLGRWFGTDEAWQVGGAFFFAVLFELFCALLLVSTFAIMRVMTRVAKSIELREAGEDMRASIEINRMRANIELDGIRLKAQQAKERADADIELALREREVEKAKAHAAALRAGTPWVDPDDLLEHEADLIRAKNEARAREIREEIEGLRSGRINPDDLPYEDKTPPQPNGRIPVGDWRHVDAVG